MASLLPDNCHIKCLMRLYSNYISAAPYKCHAANYLDRRAMLQYSRENRCRLSYTFAESYDTKYCMIRVWHGRKNIFRLI